MTCWLAPKLGMSVSLLQLTHGREASGASSRLSNEIVKGGPDVAMKRSRQILDGNPPKSTSAGKNLLGTICPAPDRGRLRPGDGRKFARPVKQRPPVQEPREPASPATTRSGTREQALSARAPPVMSGAMRNCGHA